MVIIFGGDSFGNCFIFYSLYYRIRYQIFCYTIYCLLYLIDPKKQVCFEDEVHVFVTYFVYLVVTPLGISLSLYISIRPPCAPSELIVGWWCSEHGSQNRGALGSVLMVINAILSFLFSYPSIPFPLLLSTPPSTSPPPRLDPPPVSPRGQLPTAPTTTLNPNSWAPRRRQKQSHIGPCCDKLRDSVLTVGNIGLHLLHDRLRCFLHQGRVNLCPVQVTLWHPPCQSPYHPILKLSQRLPNP